MRKTTQILVINGDKTKDILSKVEVVYKTTAWLTALISSIEKSNDNVDLVEYLDPIKDLSKREHAAAAIHKYLNGAGIPFTRVITDTINYNQASVEEVEVIKTKATKRN